MHPVHPTMLPHHPSAPAGMVPIHPGMMYAPMAAHPSQLLATSGSGPALPPTAAGPALAASGTGRSLGASGTGPSTSSANPGGSGNTGGSSGGVQGSSHRNKGILCSFFFEKGSCPLGGNCPFSHVEKGTRLPRPESCCNFYLQSSCLRESCKFFHGSENQLKKLHATGEDSYLPEDYMAVCNPYDPGRTISPMTSGVAIANGATTTAAGSLSRAAASHVDPQAEAAQSSPRSSNGSAHAAATKKDHSDMSMTVTSSNNNEKSGTGPSLSPNGSAPTFLKKEETDSSPAKSAPPLGKSGGGKGGKSSTTATPDLGKSAGGGGRTSLHASGTGGTISNHQASHAALLSHTANLTRSGAGAPAMVPVLPPQHHHHHHLHQAAHPAAYHPGMVQAGGHPGQVGMVPMPTAAPTLQPMLMPQGMQPVPLAASSGGKAAPAAPPMVPAAPTAPPAPVPTPPAGHATIAMPSGQIFVVPFGSVMMMPDGSSQIIGGATINAAAAEKLSASGGKGLGTSGGKGLSKSGGKNQSKGKGETSKANVSGGKKKGSGNSNSSPNQSAGAKTGAARVAVVRDEDDSEAPPPARSATPPPQQPIGQQNGGGEGAKEESEQFGEANPNLWFIPFGDNNDKKE